MKACRKLETAYYLFKKDRIYRDKTLSSVYFKSNKQHIEKKSRPIDINGIRYKFIKETGEVRLYKKSEIQYSLGCSTRRTKILLDMLLSMNDFDWFATLTFDKEKIDRTNDLLVYCAYKKYINNIKHQFPLFRYITVIERHKDTDHCIHFHLLIGGLTHSQLGLVNSGKVCCSWAFYKNKISSRDFFERTKNEHILTETDGLPVYNVTTFPYGFTTVTRIANREKCNSYVKKYIYKDIGASTEIFKKRFFYSHNLNRPTIVDKLIGADFQSPKNLKYFLSNNPYLQNASSINYNDDYNILQYWVDNKTKNIIDNNLIPLSKDEISQYEGLDSFKDESQLSFV